MKVNILNILYMYPIKKKLMMIDVLLMTSDIEQFAFLRTLEKDAFQENLCCKLGFVMSTFTETTSRCDWIIAISCPHIYKIL